MPVLFFLTGLIWLGGCVEFKKPEEAAPSGAASSEKLTSPIELHPKTDASSQVNWQVLGGEPNSYKVMIELTEKTQVIRKSSAGNSEILMAGGLQFTDSKVSAGQSYLYEVGSIQGNQFVAQESKEIQIPIDFVASHHFVLPRESGEYQIQAKRAFFPRDSTLVTMGRWLRIEAEEIYFGDRVTIMTFPPDQKNQMGSTGHDGGHITIRAKKAVGHLRVEMRGEHGGDGAVAGKHHERARGCIVPGKQGHVSGDSGSGGATGQLTLQIEDVREFSFADFHFQGRAGIVYPGGPGQLGSAAELHRSEVFPAENVTKVCVEGPQGPQGMPGAKGRDGEIGKTCFRFGDQPVTCR